ncbi:hypothetical protein ACEPAF_5463 [Sanghuangporus sanghuang]
MLVVWDAESGRIIGSLSRVMITRKMFILSPFHRTGSISSQVPKDMTSTVRVWDATAMADLVSSPGHANVVTSVAFSPDGYRIASASD